MIDDSPIKSSSWMIKSELTMVNSTGFASFELHFWNTKDIYIVVYEPSVKDVFYNLDLRCLSYWAQETGWNIPKVEDKLAQENIDYWKFFWSTGIVDSAFLDEMVGDKNKVPIDFGQKQKDIESGKI
jgi:hypothetical protein